MQQHITRAAANLYLSQPLVINYINVLETNLGVKLLYRKTNNIYFTKTGKIFVKYSERILSLCEETCRILAKIKNDSEKKLKIGVTNSLSIQILSNLLKSCWNLNLQLSLNFLVNSNEKIIKCIEDQKLDFAFANGDVSEVFNERNNVHITYYATDFLCLNFSNVYKKINTPCQKWYNLNYVTLGFNDPQIEYLSPLLKRNKFNGYQFKAIIQVSSVKNINLTIKLGLGISFYSLAQTEKKIKNLKTIMTRNLYLIKSHSSTNQKTFRFLIKELQKLKNFR